MKLNKTYKTGGSMCKVYLLAILLSFVSFVQAQNYPVQIIPQVTPPPPIYISNYADASTINSPLRVQLILNDLTIQSREVRLKAYFQGGGINFQSNDIVSGANSLFLEGGIPLVLTNVDLAPYFKFENITGISSNVYGSSIPEGTYQFCFEIYDVATGSILSAKSCVTTVIFQNEPPFLVMPRNESNIAETNPQNIVFQWTPRSINVTNVEYELSLVEIWDTQIDPQAAFLSSPPIFQTTTSTTTYVYGPSDPLLLSGKNYAWRIQAKAKQGLEEIGLFKNEGYSEIFSFSYASACDLPMSINHEVKGSTIANVFWDDFSTDVPEYTVRYRKKSNSGDENEWFLNKTTSNTTSLWDLKAGTIYEYQIQKQCTVTKSDWSTTKQFTTFLADNEESVYECGITPDFSLSNTDPLETLSKGDIFTAGDFPINVLEVSGSNGRFTGKGYVTIPYLNSIRVGVEFTNIFINTDKQMAEGTVKTMYDPTLKNFLDVDDAIETVSNAVDAVGELIESSSDFLNQVFNDDDAEEENAPVFEDETENSYTTNDSDNSEASNNNSSNSSTQNNTYTSTDNTSTDSIDTDTTSDTTDTTSTENEVVIVYNGTEYNNNDIIEVDYDKNNSNYAFLLKNYPEGATFNWQVLKLGTDYTEAHVTNETIHDNLGIDMKKVSTLEVVANYNNQKISITIKRKLPDFDLVNIYAKPKDKPDRVAKTGQKLYLKKSPIPLVNANREVDFSVHISPNLSKSYISSQDITWYYDTPNTQSNLGKDYGLKDIHLNLKEQESTYSVNVKAGNPNLLQKEIEIVWFDSNKTSFSIIPPAINHVLNESFEKMETSLEVINNLIPGETEISIDDISISGEQKNEEDPNSRLYYLLQTESLGGGITVEWPKIPIPIGALDIINRTGIIRIGPYIQASFGISATGEIARKKYVESNTFIEDEMSIKLTASGCLYAGAGIELLVAEDLVNFEVDFGAKACVQGEASYNFTTKVLKGEFSIPPVILQGKINIKTKSTLEFELINWTQSITITDQIPLGQPIEHQF